MLCVAQKALNAVHAVLCFDSREARRRNASLAAIARALLLSPRFRVDSLSIERSRSIHKVPVPFSYARTSYHFQVAACLHL